MASPTRTWTSLIIGLAIAYFLFYNIAQIVDCARAFENPIISNEPDPMAAAVSMETDWYLGMIGTGVLMLIYVIACLSIFLNKHEKPVFLKISKNVLYYGWSPLTYFIYFFIHGICGIGITTTCKCNFNYKSCFVIFSYSASGRDCGMRSTRHS